MRRIVHHAHSLKQPGAGAEPRLRRWFLTVVLIALSLTSSVTSAWATSLTALYDTTQVPSGKVSLSQPAGGTTYYVSKHGNNHDGRSWETAWNELNQIGWSTIRPGDTILLDGGATEMRYTTTLTVGASGTRDQPIAITRASEPGRNGQVIIFGGRSTPLPYCGQRSYRYQTSDVREVGIRIGRAAYVIIDGLHWRGITIHGHNGAGIQLSSTATTITLRNLEIYDNGSAYRDGGRWYPTRYGLSEGINLSGTDITVERAIIHDNGSDAIQSGGGVRNFTLRQSWLSNSRIAPNGETFNRCTHQDGIQIHNGGTQTGMTIADSVIGPRLLQGIIAGNARTTINDVTIRHTLFLNPENVHISNRQPRSRNWTLANVTMAGSEKHAMTLAGSGHTITASRIDSRVNTLGGRVRIEGRCARAACGAWITAPAQVLAAVPSAAPPPKDDLLPSPTPTPNDPRFEPPPSETPISDDPLPTPAPTTTPAPSPTPAPTVPLDPPIIADPPGLPEPPRLPSPGPWTVAVCIRINGEPRMICQEYTLALTEDGQLTVVAKPEQGIAR